MGLNPSGDREKKSRRVLRGDFAQMIYGSRWITFYVLSLMVGLQWLVGVLCQLFPDSALIPQSCWLFAVAFGYFTAIWLRAGERALRGRSALSEGCFSVSRRDLFYASLPYFALYLAPYLLWPVDPRRLPVWGLTCAAGMLLLPFVLLDKKSPGQACRSVRRAIECRPLLVLLTLLASAGLSVGVSRLVALGYDHLLQLLKLAAHQQIEGLAGEALRWHFTSVVAYLCQMILASLGWMLPGPAALWIYWKTRR